MEAGDVHAEERARRPSGYARLSAAVDDALRGQPGRLGGADGPRTIVMDDVVLVVLPGDAAEELLPEVRERLVPVIEREAARRVERATIMTGEQAATLMFALGRTDASRDAPQPALARTVLHDRAEVGVDLGGDVTAWSPRAEALLGWPARERIGRPLAQVVSEQSAIRVEELLATVAAGHPLAEMRTAWRTKEGMVMPLTLFAAPRLRDGVVSGATVLVESSGLKSWGVCRHPDVDVERIASIGTWKWRFASGRMTWSPQLVALHGAVVDPSNPRANLLVASAHPEDRERLRSALVRAALVPLPVSVDYRMLRSDGRLRYIHLHAEIVFDEEGVAAALVGTVQDVTELRAVAPAAEVPPAGDAPGAASAPAVIALERRLGARQHEVLALMAEGLGNAEIATRLYLSESTVKWHVKKILRELRAANRAEAVARYLRALAARR